MISCYHDIIPCRSNFVSIFISIFVSVPRYFLYFFFLLFFYPEYEGAAKTA